STVEDMKAAIEAANAAFTHSRWSSEVQFRSSILAKLSRFLASSNLEHAATILTRECGKPFKYNLTEYTNLSSVIENAAFKAKFLTGTTTNASSSVTDITLREPVGVVGIIVPWNAPISLLGRSIAPALAAGCTVVIKPASATAGATMELMKLLSLFNDLPKGVVNCVCGSGATVGSELASNKRVDMISFTGDVHTGKEILKLAANNVKKVSLELGGKSPNIVFGDGNFEKVAKASVSGACLFHAGQICFASTRILVERTHHDEFIRAFRSTVEKMKIGHGLDPNSEIGPVVSRAQLEHVMEYIETGKKESKLVMGGHKLEGTVYSGGNFIEPTLFDDVPTSSKIAQDEIFGPVVTVTSFDTIDEAVRLANDTAYGLSAMMWTNDLTKAIVAAKSTRAGMVWINSQPRGSGYFNSSGIVGSAYKESGIGSMGSVEEYTLLKRIHVELPS
ncbi:MAG: aldehyde dehydrogenase, partial [Nitrososphaerota archaeon]|nr:aldehyde dehydrogenase [Nitrososphaerota archaeon]